MRACISACKILLTVHWVTSSLQFSLLCHWHNVCFWNPFSWDQRNDKHYASNKEAKIAMMKWLSKTCVNHFRPAVTIPIFPLIFTINLKTLTPSLMILLDYYDQIAKMERREKINIRCIQHRSKKNWRMYWLKYLVSNKKMKRGILCTKLSLNHQ